MKKKINVYYTVQYEKEIELDLDENIFKNINTDSELTLYHSKLIDRSDNYEKLKNLPIPNTNNLDNCLQTSYVNNSLQINYFKQV